MMTGCGSVLWMAPEILNGDIFNEKVDVFSYAMCLVEVIDRHLPWTGCSNAGVVPLKVVRGERPDAQLTSHPGSTALAKLVRECWAQDPRDRPSFGRVLKRLQELQPPNAVIPKREVRSAAIHQAMQGDEVPDAALSVDYGGAE